VTLPEAPRRRLQVYETAAVTVTFDPNRCIHSGVCLRTLPAVFDVGRRRWVRPELAAAGEVIAAVRKCPSGALQIREPGVPGVAGGPVEH
jgi:uncharacterized Fe-S cluster protein YjdI